MLSQFNFKAKKVSAGVFSISKKRDTPKGIPLLVRLKGLEPTR